jgi:hypothetical protein
MTTYDQSIVSCAACGHRQQVSRLMSTGIGGSPDLDLRPGGYGRSALVSQVERCKACGYCAACLDMPLPDRCRQTMQGAEYQALAQRQDLPREALYSACRGLIEEGAGSLEEAGLSALRAAWVCDDVQWQDAARELRTVAARRLETDLASGPLASPLAGQRQAQIADIWRRAGQFDKAAQAARRAMALASAPADLGRPLVDMLRMQLQLAQARDDRAYTVAEAAQAAPDWPQIKAERDAQQRQQEAARERARLDRLAAESPRAFVAAFAALAGEFAREVPPAGAGHAVADMKAWLDRLPMPVSMRAIMTANVRAYGWPVGPALAAFALAALERLDPAEQQRCAAAAAVWRGALGEHEVLLGYLRWCLRQAAPGEWHYAPAQHEAEGPRPPRGT